MTTPNNPHAFHFTVDEEHNKTHNELYRDSSRIGRAAFIFAAVLVVFAFIISRVYTGGVGWLMASGLAIMAVISIYMGFTLPKKVGTPQQLYDQFQLSPATIAEVDASGITLLALVNQAVDPAVKPVWALTIRHINGLPGHDTRVGEHVPSVAVNGKRKITSQELWSEISPMPIAWGTPDTSVISTAENAIPRSQWRKLDSLKSRLQDVKDAPDHLLTL